MDIYGKGKLIAKRSREPRERESLNSPRFFEFRGYYMIDRYGVRWAILL